MRLASNEVESEEPVIAAIQQGDPYAFRELVQRHHRWVCGVIFSVLADSDRVDDVAQQVWTQAWERMRTLRDPASWKPWLYRLARNAAVDAGRDTTRRRQRSTVMTDESSFVGGDRRPDQAMADHEERTRLLRAIQALPALYREPFVLRHLNDWSYAEIGSVMNMPVETVETRLVRARRLLREALGGRDDPHSDGKASH